MNQIHQPRVLHGDEPAAVAVGGAGHLALLLHIYLSVIVHRQGHLLLEEMHVFRAVAEKFVLRQELHCGLMVLVAGHHEEMDPCVRLAHHLHQVVHQALEYIEFPGDADVIHALGVVRAKPGAHAPCQQHRGHLARPDGFDSGGGEGFPVGLDLRKLHGRKGSDDAPLQQLLLMLAGVQDVHVGAPYLLQQRRLSGRGQLVVVFQDMLLTVLFQFLLCLCQCDAHFSSSFLFMAAIRHLHVSNKDIVPYIPVFP